MKSEWMCTRTQKRVPVENSLALVGLCTLILTRMPRQNPTPPSPTLTDGCIRGLEIPQTQAVANTIPAQDKQ